MLYIGLIQDGDKDRMYVSSEPEEAPEDRFSMNVVFIDFGWLASRGGDPVSQRAELNKLRNVLVAGGAQVTIETV